MLGKKWVNETTDFVGDLKRHVWTSTALLSFSSHSDNVTDLKAFYRRGKRAKSTCRLEAVQSSVGATLSVHMDRYHWLFVEWTSMMLTCDFGIQRNLWSTILQNWKKLILYCKLYWSCFMDGPEGFVWNWNSSNTLKYRRNVTLMNMCARPWFDMVMEKTIISKQQCNPAKWIGLSLAENVNMHAAERESCGSLVEVDVWSSSHVKRGLGLTGPLKGALFSD